MANRHLSRSIVLQTLFEWDFAAGQKNLVWDHDEIEKRLAKNIEEFGPGLKEDVFLKSLIYKVVEKKKILDEVIAKAAPDWPLEKIAVIDRNILRIGLTELLFGDRKEVPPKVAINEAIELGKTFGGENSGKFVNGVLGAVYKELGNPGKDETSRSKKNTEIDSDKITTEKLGGALVYARKDGEVYFALVHDVFGYWTLSKGTLESGEDVEIGTAREIKKEIDLDVKILEKLGENEYIASHPERGKLRKQVTYFLAESEYGELRLGESGGLDQAKWFPLREVPSLRVYSDLLPIITKATELILKNG